MIYAPVMIPTCNRYEHLKECIESLKKNKYATKTEIYISVDYPPAERYFVGYDEVINYVKELQHSSEFACVNVYVQKKNLGPFNNLDFLEKEIKKKYDRAIISEDDNVFAPNFLEYCDYYLEKYKDDPRVYMVCGHQPYGKLDTDASAVLLGFMEPYGMGVWFEKYDAILNWLQAPNIYKQISSISKGAKFRRKHKTAFNLMVSGFLEDPRFPYVQENGDAMRIDVFNNMYMILEGLVSVFPSCNLVENNGNDGSGVNCGVKSSEHVVIAGANLIFDLDGREPVMKISAPKPETNGMFGWLRIQKPLLMYILFLMKHGRKWKQYD